VIVLVHAAVGSATFRFAAAAREHGLALLAGEPTGGNRRGINGSAYFFLRLPRSRIEVDVPLVAMIAEGEPPDAGLVPDVVVAPTAADLARGLDVALERAKAITSRAGP
jgi:C-terminal processing protease CtpA/Prc